MDENLSKNKISERKQKRREMLAGYFFDLSKLMCSGVVVGGLSPLFTGDEMGIFNYPQIRKQSQWQSQSQ